MPGTEKNRSISSEPPTVSRMDWGIYCTMGTMASVSYTHLIQAQILQLIRDLQKELGMSVIYITHDLGNLFAADAQPVFLGELGHVAALVHLSLIHI